MAEMPQAKLLSGEVNRELIGTPKQSLQLTSHRVIRTREENGLTQSEVIFLDKVESVKYSRKIDWGYLGAAVFFGLVLGFAGMGVDSLAGPRNSTSYTPWGIGMGVLSAAIFVILFLLSRRAMIRICGGTENIEVSSDAKAVNEIIEFIEKVQASIIERNPGPKAKAD